MSNDAAALTQAIEKFYDAIRKKDAAAFESLVTPRAEGKTVSEMRRLVRKAKRK